MKLLDFAEDNGWWRFRFGGGDDFTEALLALKRIPLVDRQYHPDQKHLWEVRVSEANHARMSGIFENFANCLAIIKASVRLPGF
jgi:hypothetical protein